MLEWSEKFATGHALMDTQHRMLIGYINRLEIHAQKPSLTPEDISLFMRAIEFLETYVLTHFREEEECMHRHKCPVQRDNKLAHGKFLAFFRAFKARLDAEGYRQELVQELHEACSSWIQEHIMRLDVQLKPCLKSATGPVELN
jgi:hemerythrin